MRPHKAGCRQTDSAKLRPWTQTSISALPGALNCDGKWHSANWCHTQKRHTPSLDFYLFLFLSLEVSTSCLLPSCATTSTKPKLPLCYSLSCKSQTLICRVPQVPLHHRSGHSRSPAALAWSEHAGSKSSRACRKADAGVRSASIPHGLDMQPAGRICSK